MNKKVAFTCIMGKYDKWEEPLFVSPGFDHILFTDQPIKSNIYKIIKIKSGDGYKTAKTIKILMNLPILNDYHQLIWHDGNFPIKKDLNDLPEQFFVDHPLHDCAYDEIDLCLKLGKDTEDKLEWCRQTLQENKWPVDQGAFACGIMSRLNNDQTEEFNKAWWSVISKFSMRDQIFFPYLVDRYNMPQKVITWKKVLEYFKWNDHA